MNAHFDRVIAKEKDLERRTVLAANELLTKKSGAFAHDVDDRKRKRRRRRRRRRKRGRKRRN